MGYTKTNEAVFSNELLDTVIEHSFDGIYITDGQANTLKVNRSYLNDLRTEGVRGIRRQHEGACKKWNDLRFRNADGDGSEAADHDPAGI